MEKPIFPCAEHPQSQPVSDEAPKVGVIYNPRSHGNRGADFDCGISPQVHIAQPGHREQLPVALAEFAARGIELLVINGGDGTVRDVLTCGAKIFGDDWPTIAVIPKGKTNALTVDLGIPAGWSMQNAIDAFEHGNRTYRHPIDVDPLNENSSDHVRGFILGAGSFTAASQAAQGAHKLGAFHSGAIAVTTVVVVAQWFFASRANPWRRGSRMKIRLGAQQALMEHSGKGDPEWRQMLFASTLETLPTGIQPFGHLREGLKLVVVDQISRRTAMLLPVILRGRYLKNLRARGIHQIATPQFTLEIENELILDGEAFPAGEYRIAQGPELEFVTP